jgi:hypothetical protein
MINLRVALEYPQAELQHPHFHFRKREKEKKDCVPFCMTSNAKVSEEKATKKVFN